MGFALTLAIERQKQYTPKSREIQEKKSLYDIKCFALSRTLLLSKKADCAKISIVGLLYMKRRTGEIKTACFKIFRGNFWFHWLLVTPENEVIAEGGGYKTKKRAKEVIDFLRANGNKLPVFDYTRTSKVKIKKVA